MNIDIQPQILQQLGSSPSNDAQIEESEQVNDSPFANLLSELKGNLEEAKKDLNVKELEPLVLEKSNPNEAEVSNAKLKETENLEKGLSDTNTDTNTEIKKFEKNLLSQKPLSSTPEQAIEASDTPLKMPKQNDEIALSKVKSSKVKLEEEAVEQKVLKTENTTEAFNKAKKIESFKFNMDANTNAKANINLTSNIKENIKTNAKANANSNTNKEAIKAYGGKVKSNSFYMNNKVNPELTEIKTDLKEDLSLKLVTSPEFSIDKAGDSLGLEEARHFIANREIELSNNNQELKVSKSPVFQLETIEGSSIDQVIEKISEYIAVQKVNGETALDLNVNHKSLGQFKIQLQQNKINDTIDMKIVSNAADTVEFFKQHETEILKSLQSVGVKMSDFKVLSGALLVANEKGFSEGKQEGQNQNFHSNQDKANEHKQHDANGGSQKRRELWNHYKEQMSA